MMEDGRDQSRIFRWEVLVLVAAALLAYGPALLNNFVCDDEIYVLTNPLVTGKLDLKRILTESYPPGRPEQGLYRPLVTLSYWLDRQVWGLGSAGAFGFHLTNNLLHALNGVLFLYLLRRLGMERRPRFFASLIFAVHPVLCEAVAWVVGRAELLGAMWGLLAILAFLREPCGLRRGAVLLLWVLAMLCKEQWLMLPALIAALAVCRPSAVRLENRPWLRAAILAVLVGVAFWGARSLAVGSWRPELAAYRGVVSTSTRVTTALAILWNYVGLWLYPMRLSIHHDVQPWPGGIGTVLMVASWAAAFGLAWRWRSRSPWPLLALVWFWLALLPVSNVILPVGAVFGERFLYVPTLFFAPLLVEGCQRLARWRSRDLLRASGLLSLAILAIQVLCSRLTWVEALLPLSLAVLWVGASRSVRSDLSISRSAAALLGVMAVGAYVGTVWVRLGDWRSNLTLWEAAARCYPKSLAIKAPLVEVLLREGRYAEAHELAGEALVQLENQPRVYQKLLTPRLTSLDLAARTAMLRKAWYWKFSAANQVAQASRLREALEMYRELMQDYPGIPETFEAAGDVYVRLENPVAARQHFEEAVRLGCSSPDLFAKYGTVMSKLGSKAEALVAYEQSLRGNPRNPLVHHNRGMVLVDLGDYPAALEAFREATRLAPSLPEPRLNAAGVLLHLRRFEEAEREVIEVLKTNPGQEQAGELFERIAKARGPRKK